MTKFFERCWLPVLGGLLLVLTGCSGDPEQHSKGSDEYQAKLFPTTIELGAESLDALESLSEDGSLFFHGTPGELKDVRPSRVLLAPAKGAAKNGFVRMVTKVEHTSNGLLLSSVQVPIQLAFQKLHVRFERQIDDFAEGTDKWASNQPLFTVSDSHWEEKEVDFFAFNGDGNAKSEDDQVRVTGKLGGGFSYTFTLDVDWDDVFEVPDAVLDCATSLGFGCDIMSMIPEAKVSFDVTAGASAELTAKGTTFLPMHRKYSLGVVKLPVIPVGPLYFFPEVEVEAEVEAEASSQFTLSTRADGSVTTGISFSNKGLPDPKLPDPDFEFSAPMADATLQARTLVRVGPRLHLRLYDVMGPHAAVKAFAELTADREHQPCWELNAGLDVELGFDVVVQGLPVIGSVELGSWRDSWTPIKEKVASGSCPALSGDPAPSPTGGMPGEQAFANPKFAPWSRTYAAATGFAYGTPGTGIDWTQASASIDGRLVLVGSDTKTLTKIDTTGALVWSRRYLQPEMNLDTGTNELSPSNVVHAGDATMLVAAHPFALMKVEAGGFATEARQFDVEYEEREMRITALVAAGDGGYYLGANYGTERAYHLDVDAWVMRLDANADVVWAKRWGAPGVGETVRALVPVGSGVVAIGATWEPTESNWTSWAVRLGAEGQLVWGRRIQAAAPTGGSRSTFFTSGLVTEQGDLVLAGSIHYSYDDTLVVKLTPDGDLAWSSAELTADIHDTGPTIHSIVALPTSGYLASGSIRYSPTGTWSDTDSDTWLGMLDSVGRVMWLRRFGGKREEGGIPQNNDAVASLLLTKDGGALFLSYTDSLTPKGDGLWAMKVPAKSGELAFDAGNTAGTAALDMKASDSVLSVETWQPSVTSFVVQPKPIDVKVEAAPLEVYTQAGG